MPKYVRPCLKIPEYVAWQSMWARVRSPKNASNKKYYMDKGITVCERWQSSQAFLDDMGKKPRQDYTLERIDGNKGYGPDNCVWATPLQQVWNRPVTRWIEFNGEKLPASAWASRLGITKETMYSRLKRWPLEKALTMPRQR